tara:strand:- start:1625 stop:3640 length:2016 start_codon:yes stop_codon:yes gene_type:complete
MGLFDEIGKKIEADLKRALLGGSNQNAGLQPIDRKSLQMQNRIAQAGDGPNFLSGGRTVPTYGIDTSKSYLENLYIMNNDEGAGGGLNGIPVPPNAGFKPAKYSPETRAYDQGEGEVYNAQTGVREFTQGLATDPVEMVNRLKGSVEPDNTAKDEQQAREKIKDVHKPLLPEGTQTGNNDTLTSTISEKRETPYETVTPRQDMQVRLDGSVGEDTTAKDEQQAREKITNVHKPFPSTAVPTKTEAANKSADGILGQVAEPPSSLGQTIEDRRDNSYSNRIEETEIGEVVRGGAVLQQPAVVDFNNNASSSAPLHSAKERGRAKQQYDSFKTQYNDALGRLKGEQDQRLNDIKTKDDIDKLVENYSVKSGRIDNTKAYESDYKTGKNKGFQHDGKMRMPKYSGFVNGSVNDRIDKFNELSVLDVSNDELKVREELEHSDFIALYFHDLVNKKYIPFRALILSMSDQFDATYNAVNYLGRADAAQIYGGCGRTFSISFMAHAFSVEELHPMWQRINHLCGLTKPARYTNATTENSGSSFIEPPLVKFNLGDIYRNQPAIITSVAVNLPNEGQWELTNNSHTGKHQKYDYLNETIKREKEGLRTAKYPTQCELSVSMTFLEKRLPETTNRHFGDSAEERPSGMYGSRGKTDSDLKTNFNETLNSYPKNPADFGG